MFTLADELALCGFSKKEVDKNSSFCYLVNNRLEKRFETVIDLCAGNGLAGFLVSYYRSPARSILVDIKKPRNFSRAAKLFEKYEMDFNYIERDMNSVDLSCFDRPLIIAVHACGRLSDEAIRIGLENSIPFAVMTCCHENDSKKYALENPPDSRLLKYDEKQDYLDLVRKRYIEERGWKCELLEIPKRITPKNHILIGLPYKLG